MVVITPIIKHCVHRNVQMMAIQQINVVQTLKRRFFRSILIFLPYPWDQKYLKTSQSLPHFWRQKGDTKKGYTEDSKTWRDIVKRFIRPDSLASWIHAPLFLFKTMSLKRNFSYRLHAQIFYKFISPKCAVLWHANSIVFHILTYGERTNYDIHLYRIFSNFFLEILLGPQSHSPQNPVWEPFIQIRTTPAETTNFTRFIWRRSRRITKTQTDVCIHAAYRIQISMNLYLERLSHT